MPLTAEYYTVGWICALPKEQTAAKAMLDEIHPKLPKPPNDTNTYTLGSIGGHNIVISCLSKGQIGTNSAANVAAQMVQTFPGIKFGLMVGIGGGVPPKVRLGDVVVSTPVDQYPGVVQWDFGKAEKDGVFRRTGALNNPPSALLSALGELESTHEMEGSKVRQYLEEMGKKWPRLASKYMTYEHLKDPLSDSVHSVDDQADDVRVHYGLIESGNQVIKDAETRDRVNETLGGNVLCFEMEAAGLMNNFPCLVIRGICDYADSGKSKDWQEYAAAVAATFAKEFLEFVQPSDVDNERPVKEILGQVLTAVSSIQENVLAAKSRLERKEDLEICDWLIELDYGAQHSDYLRRRQQGTGQWLLDSNQYQTWLHKRGQTLFCPGIPGAGKTIITAIIIDDLCKRSRNDDTIRYAYLYCNYRRQEKQTTDHFLLALLGQILRQSESIPEQVRSLCERHKSQGTRPSLPDVIKALHSVAGMPTPLYVIIDALDECSAPERTNLLLEIFDLQAKCQTNFLATSRFINSITEKFMDSPCLEIRTSSDDLQNYLGNNMYKLPAFVGRDQDLQHEISSVIVQAVDGIFLLAQLYLDSLEDKVTTMEVEHALEHFKQQQPGAHDPQDGRKELPSLAYRDAAERILEQRSGFRCLATRALLWIVRSRRPLTTLELQHALATDRNAQQFDTRNIPDIDDIVSVCLGLVTVDGESSIVRLVHYTTQEYFERTDAAWILKAEDMIATTCVAYLMLSSPTHSSQLTSDDLETHLSSEQMPLYDYAAQYWGLHSQKSSSIDVNLTLHFIESNHGVMAWVWRMLLPNSSDAQDLEMMKTSNKRHHTWNLYKGAVCKDALNLEPMHLAATYGLSQLAVILRQRGHEQDPVLIYRTSPWSMPDSKVHKTPLCMAVEGGHTVMAALLLSWEDVNPNGVSGHEPPLYTAAMNGHEAIVKLLLQREGVDPNPSGREGFTALFMAAEGDHMGVVRLLLDRTGAELDTDLKEQKALLVLAQIHGRQVIERLLYTRYPILGEQSREPSYMPSARDNTN